MKIKRREILSTAGDTAVFNSMTNDEASHYYSMRVLRIRSNMYAYCHSYTHVHIHIRTYVACAADMQCVEELL